MIHVLRTIGETSDIVGAWSADMRPSRAIAISALSLASYPDETEAVESGGFILLRLIPRRYVMSGAPVMRAVRLEGGAEHWRARVKLEVLPAS